MIHPTNYRVLRWMDEIGAIPVHTEDGYCRCISVK